MFADARYEPQTLAAINYQFVEQKLAASVQMRVGCKRRVQIANYAKSGVCSGVVDAICEIKRARLNAVLLNRLF